MDKGRSSFLSYVILLFLLLGLNASCTKKATNASVTLNFSKSSQSQFSFNYEIENIIVVEGDRQLEWNCSDEYESKDNCEDISFEPSGKTDHIIQILVIAGQKNLTTGVRRMKFFYSGDLYTLKAGDNPLDIKLSEVESEDNMAIVSGRYIPKSGHKFEGQYLTGAIDVMYKNNSTMPEIKVLNAEIFGGFTRLYIFKNLPFRYKFKGHGSASNELIEGYIFNDLYSGTGLTVNSAGLATTATSKQIIHLGLNSGSYWDKYNNPPEERVFVKRILGFFGQNPGNRYICASSDANAVVYDDVSGDSMCSTATCASHYSWSDITTLGDMSSSNICSVDIAGLSVDVEDLPNEDDFIDHFGPFVGGGSQIESVDFDDDTMTLEWNWAPNVYLPNGMEIFISNAPENFNRDLFRLPKTGGIDCKKIRDGNYGFVSKGIFRPTDQQTSFQVPAGEATANMKMAVCLRKTASTYYGTGHVDDGKEGYQNLPPVGLVIRKLKSIDFESAHIVQDVCVPMEVSLLDKNNNPTSSSSNHQLTLVSPGEGDFYDDYQKCLGATIPTTSLNLNYTRVVFYRQTASDGITASVKVTDDNGLLTDSLNFGYTSAAPQTVTEIRVIPDFYRNPDKFEAAHTEGCVPLYLAAFFEINGKLELANSTDTVNLGDSNTGYTSGNVVGSLHSTPTTCGQTPVTNLAFPSSSLLPVWINLPASDVGLASNIVVGCTATTCPDRPLQVVNPGPANNFRMDIRSNTMRPGDCAPINVGFYDGSIDHYPSLFPWADQLSINPKPGSSINYLMFSNPTCALGNILDPRDYGVAVSAASGPATVYIQPQGGSSVAIEGSFGTNYSSDNRIVSGEEQYRVFASDSSGNSVVDFGSMTLGTPKQVDITLYNYSSTDLDLTGTFTGAFYFSSAGGPGNIGKCETGAGNIKVNANSSCTVEIEFNTGVTGDHTGTLDFDWSGSVGSMQFFGSAF